MALRIPVYDQQQASSRPLPVNPESLGDASPEAMGAGLTQGLNAVSGAASHIGQLYQQERNKADEAQALEALNALKANTQQRMDAVQQAKGKDALAAAGDAYTANDADAKAIFGGLVNDQQKRLFAAHAEGELLGAKRLGEAHVRQQVDEYQTHQFVSANELSVQHAVRFPGDVGGIAVEVTNVKGRAEMFAKARGMSPEQTSALALDEASKVYVAQAETLLKSGRGIEAMEVINAHRDDLGTKAVPLIGEAQSVAVAQKGEQAAQALEVKFGRPDGSIDGEAGRAWIDGNIPAGLERDQAVARFEHRVERAHNEKNADESLGFTNALRAMEAQSADPTRRTVGAIPPALMAKVTPQGRIELEALEWRYKHEAESAPRTNAQLAALSKLIGDLDSNPGQFAGKTEPQIIATYAPVLAKKDLDTMVPRIAAGVARFQKPGLALPPPIEAQLRQTMKNNGLYNPAEKDPYLMQAQDARLADAHDHMIQWEADFKNGKGDNKSGVPRPPTLQEYNAEIATTLAKGRIDSGHLYERDTRNVTVLDARRLGKEQGFKVDVPSAMLPRLQKLFLDKGVKNPTSEQLRSAYLRFLRTPATGSTPVFSAEQAAPSAVAPSPGSSSGE